MALALLFLSLMLNMFRMLIHPSSGACNLFVELFHGLYWSGTMCVGVTLWFGCGGVVFVCRLKPAYKYARCKPSQTQPSRANCTFAIHVTVVCGNNLCLILLNYMIFVNVRYWDEIVYYKRILFITNFMFKLSLNGWWIHEMWIYMCVCLCVCIYVCVYVSFCTYFIYQCFSA